MTAGGKHSRDAILAGPISRTLFSMTWPMVITTLVNSWQVLASVFWVGQLIGTGGLSTIAIMDPMIQIVMLTMGTALIGVQTLTAKATGRQDNTAIPILINGGYVAGGFALLVTVVGLVFSGPLSRVLAGDIGVAHDLRAYLVPWLCFFLAPTLNGVLMFGVDATGWTRFGLIQSIIAVGFVIAFTPLFVAGFHLGLTGVALSDGLSDTLMLVLGCLVIYKFRKDLGLGEWKPSHKRPDFRLWKEIAGHGLFYQAARAMDFVAQLVMVRIMLETDHPADVAGYGVTTLLIGNIAGALSRMGVACSIMVGQNVGAHQPERARKILRTTVIWLAAIAGALVVLATYPQPLVRVFSSDPEVVARATATIHGLRWNIPAGLISMTLLRTYTAVSKNKLGSTISIVCAVAAIVLAEVVPGTPLERVVTGLVASQYLRLFILAAFYRRSFADVINS